MDKPLKKPPPYAIASVDHALRAAVMLQLEGGLTVSEVAERGLVAIGVAVRGADGTAQAGLAVSIPSVRYHPDHLQPLVATLQTAARRLEADVAPA